MQDPAETSTSERKKGEEPSRQSLLAKYASWHLPPSKGVLMGAAQSGESDIAPGAVGVEMQSRSANVVWLEQAVHCALQPNDSTPPPLGPQVAM